MYVLALFTMFVCNNVSIIDSDAPQWCTIPPEGPDVMLLWFWDPWIETWAAQGTQRGWTAQVPLHKKKNIKYTIKRLRKESFGQDLTFTPHWIIRVHYVISQHMKPGGSANHQAL